MAKTIQETAFAICERVAEAQTLLNDHIEGGKHSAETVVAKLNALLSEAGLLRAMWQIGYFPVERRRR
jgi:hypothetical protein